MSDLWSRYEREIARCDRELEEMRNQPSGQPAYLTALGILDWEREKRLIEEERRQNLQRTAANAGGI